MLRTGEASKMLGVTQNTLLKYIRTGRIRAINISTTKRDEFRLEQADVDAFLASITKNPDQGAA